MRCSILCLSVCYRWLRLQLVRDGEFSTLTFGIITVNDGFRPRVAVGWPQGRQARQVVRKALQPTKEGASFLILTRGEHPEQPQHHPTRFP